MRVVSPTAVNGFGRKAVLHEHESMLSGKTSRSAIFNARSRYFWAGWRSMSSDAVKPDALVVAVEELIQTSFDPLTLSSQFIYKQVGCFIPLPKCW